MRTRLAAISWLGLFVSLSLGSAQAGSPGSADRKDALPHVCLYGPLRGERCDPTLPQDCGTRNRNTPIPCLPDFQGKPTLRGTLWVIVDEDVGDNTTAGRPPAATILLEIKAGGARHQIVETFQGAGPDGPEIGNWLPFGEDEIEDLESSFVFQTPVEALGHVGDALKAIAGETFGGDFSSTIPVFFQARLVPRAIADASARAGLGALGRSRAFRIQVVFLDP